MDLLISCASGLAQIAGYALYNWLMRKGDIRPNSASWLIWTIGSLLNMASYVSMTGDIVKDILPITCSIACIATFIHTILIGRFSRPDGFEWCMVATDLSITAVWMFMSATEASLLYQVGTIISFFPMMKGVASGHDKESPAPWLVWTIAYALFTTTVCLRYEKWQDLAYPVVCLILHGAMTRLAFKHPQVASAT